MRFAIPLCGSFCLWRDPLWSYGTKSGLAEKQFFKLRKKCFFAHAWTASNPRKINTWVDLGTWNIVFPKNLKKNWGFADKQFFELRKIALSHILGLLPIHAHAWTFQTLLNAQKVPHRDSNPPTRSDRLTITLQEPCLEAILLSYSLSLLWLQRAGFSMGCSCDKKN